MNTIPIYSDHLSTLKMEGPCVLRRWLVAEGALVDECKPVAEVESALWTAEIVCPYSGRLRQNLLVGEPVNDGLPIGYIDSSPEEYDRYLRTGGRIDFSISLSPAELEKLEARRGGLSREAYLAALVRRGLQE